MEDDQPKLNLTYTLLNPFNYYNNKICILNLTYTLLNRLKNNVCTLPEFSIQTNNSTSIGVYCPTVEYVE